MIKKEIRSTSSKAGNLSDQKVETKNLNQKEQFIPFAIPEVSSSCDPCSDVDESMEESRDFDAMYNNLSRMIEILMDMDMHAGCDLKHLLGSGIPALSKLHKEYHKLKAQL